LVGIAPTGRARAGVAPLDPALVGQVRRWATARTGCAGGRRAGGRCAWRDRLVLTRGLLVLSVGRSRLV